MLVLLPCSWVGDILIRLLVRALEDVGRQPVGPEDEEWARVPLTAPLFRVRAPAGLTGPLHAPEQAPALKDCRCSRISPGWCAGRPSSRAAFVLPPSPAGAARPRPVPAQGNWESLRNDSCLMREELRPYVASLEEGWEWANEGKEEVSVRGCGSGKCEGRWVGGGWGSSMQGARVLHIAQRQAMQSMLGHSLAWAAGAQPRSPVHAQPWRPRLCGRLTQALTDVCAASRAAAQCVRLVNSNTPTHPRSAAPSGAW